MSQNTTAHRIYRIALFAESTLNIGSLIPMILAPDATLAYLTTEASTPVSRSLLQWLGALVALATAPLLLAYPNPSSTSASSVAATTERRRLAYTILSISEFILASVTGWQYLRGDSGIKDGVLLTATASVGGLGVMRALLLYAKSQWMVPPNVGAAKKQ